FAGSLGNRKGLCLTASCKFALSGEETLDILRDAARKFSTEVIRIVKRLIDYCVLFSKPSLKSQYLLKLRSGIVQLVGIDPLKEEADLGLASPLPSFDRNVELFLKAGSMWTVLCRRCPPTLPQHPDK